MILYRAPVEPRTEDLTDSGFQMIDRAHALHRAYRAAVRSAVEACPRVPVITPHGRESWRMLSCDPKGVTLARDHHTVMHGYPIRFSRHTRRGIGPHGQGLVCGPVDGLIRRLTRERACSRG